MACFEQNRISELLPYYWISVFGGCVFGGIWIFVSLYYRLRNNASAVKSTQKLQFMLFRALVAQMIVTGFCLIVPMTIVSVVLILRPENGTQISMLSMGVVSTNDLFDFLAIAYFIKRYRDAILRTLRLSRGRKTCKSLQCRVR